MPNVSKSLCAVSGDILVTNFLNIEETTFCSDIGLPKIFQTVDDGGPDSASDAIVVRLTDTTDCRDIRLEQEMLRVI